LADFGHAAPLNEENERGKMYLSIGTTGYQTPE